MNGLTYCKPTGLVLSGKAVGPGVAGGGSSNPYPVIANSRLWLDRNRNVYTDTSGASLAPLDGTIGSWRAVGGAWGTDLLTQPTGASQPIIRSNGIQCDGTDDRLLLPSSISLAGNWTMYVVSSRGGATETIQWANNNGTGILGNFGGSQFYNFPNGTGAFTDAYTALCIRRYRNISGTTGFLKFPGTAEGSHVVSSGLTWDRIFGRTGESNSSGVRFRQLVFVQKTITPDDADDLAIRAKLLELEPGTTDLT